VAGILHFSPSWYAANNTGWWFFNSHAIALVVTIIVPKSRSLISLTYRLINCLLESHAIGNTQTQPAQNLHQGYSFTIPVQPHLQTWWHITRYVAESLTRPIRSKPRPPVEVPAQIPYWSRTTTLIVPSPHLPFCEWLLCALDPFQQGVHRWGISVNRDAKFASEFCRSCNR
jgi:hypothetical protein